MVKLVDKTIWLVVFFLFILGLTGLLDNFAHAGCNKGGFSYWNIFFVMLPLLKLFFFRFRI